MAAEVRNSQLIANALATPPIMAPVGASHGKLRTKICRVALAAAGEAGDLHRICKLQAHDHLIDVEWMGTANAAMDDNDLGIFTPGTDLTTLPTEAATGQHDTLAVGYDMSAGSATWAKLFGQGIAVGLFAQLMGLPLWQMCAIATEPVVGTEYELVLTANGIVTDELDYYVYRVTYVGRGD